MTFLTKNLNITNVPARGSRYWQLKESLVYKGSRHTFMVPPGFVTDFATVPQALQSLYPATGDYTKSAILHDYFCEELRRVHLARQHGAMDLYPAPVSSTDADGLFRRTMAESGVKIVRRWLMWTGVRWGALMSAHRRAGWLQEAWKVILISIPAAPVFFLLFLVNGTIGLIERMLP